MESGKRETQNVNPTISSCKNAIIVIVFFVGTAGLTIAQSAKTTPCVAPEHHKFDFWVGDWDTFDIDKPNDVIARNHVSQILDGCVLLEDYNQNDGHHGESFTIYDASRGVWHQSWVTNRGELLIAEGKFHDDELVLSGTDQTQDGKGRQVRVTWKPVNGGVRETSVTSIDGGKTWQQWFDITFRPHKP